MLDIERNAKMLSANLRDLKSYLIEETRQAVKNM